MNQFAQRASLHEKAVQKAAEYKPVQKPRRKGERMVRSVTTLKMDMRVWKKALEIAGGDVYRIQVLASDEVIVWNNHKWRNNAKSHR